MPQRNPETLPTPTDPTGLCPWCGFVSHFDSTGAVSLAIRHNGSDPGVTHTHWASTLRCLGCKRGTVVITDQMGSGIHWYPAPGMGLLDKQVNKGVASAYNEGMRCLSIGANRAAAVMFRSALSLFVKDKGNEKAKEERHLKNALKHMKTDGSLHSSLADWADHLNQLGNEGAHPEDYDDVTAKEAVELSDFVRHLIRHEYEMPAHLLRSRGLLNDSEVGDDGVPEDSVDSTPSGEPGAA